MPDYLTLIKAQETLRGPLDARMQTDEDLVFLLPYIMTDTDKKKVPDIINVTLNRAAVFAANVIAAMAQATEQVVVESDRASVDTNKIERFQEAAFVAADSLLSHEPGHPRLGGFADTQLCLRGRTGRRILFREEDGLLIPDIAPWDGRYIFYGAQGRKLRWAAYKTFKSKEQIDGKYNIAIQGKGAELVDVWDEKVNEIYVGGKLMQQEKHDYGEPPVVIEVVSLGYGGAMLPKKDMSGNTTRQKHIGESIFFLIRDIIPELNRLASILQTLNLKAVKAPTIQTKRGGGEGSEYDTVMGMGSNTVMDVGEGVTPINYGDAKQSAQMLFNIMERALQSGSLTDVDLGNLQFPLSAVALVELGEGRDQVFFPRFNAKAELNKATAEMIIRQVRQIGGSVRLGPEGHEKTYNTHDLDGEYAISYKYYTKSPKVDIARMSVAAEASKYFDRGTVLKDVLKVEDWEGVVENKYAEMAEEMNPLIRQHRIIMALFDKAERGDENAAWEAQIMAQTMGLTAAQLQAGQTDGQPPVPKSEPLLPLLGEGGQTGGIPASAKGAREMKLTP